VFASKEFFIVTDERTTSIPGALQRGTQTETASSSNEIQPNNRSVVETGALKKPFFNS
jgi:hypothetical protein